MSVSPRPLTFGVLPWNIQTTNPYQELMAEGMEKIGLGVERLTYQPFLPISQALANSDADVLLLDWAHSFYTSPGTAATLLKTAAGMLDRRRVRHRRIPIIWNVHNLHRHDNRHRTLEQWSFRRLARTVDGIRVFNQNSVLHVRDYLAVPDQIPVRYIPHGHYNQLLGHDSKLDLAEKFGVKSSDFVLLVLGEIREGKGVVGLAKSFCTGRQPGSGVKLIIAGRPQNQSLASELDEVSAAHPDITLHLDYIPNAQMLNFLDLAHFVVLPYERMLNSGMALLALGAGKPLLATEVFQGQFPPDLVLTGPLADPTALIRVVSKARQLDQTQLRRGALDFIKSRDWTIIAEQLHSFGQDLLTKYTTKQ